MNNRCVTTHDPNLQPKTLSPAIFHVYQHWARQAAAADACQVVPLAQMTH